MDRRLTELYMQRGQLQERIAAQRTALAQQVLPLQRVLDLPHRAGQLLESGLAYLKQHPATCAAFTAAVLVFKPGFVWRWSKRSFFAWRAWRAVRGVWPRR